MAVAQQEGTFLGVGNLRLFYQRWLPAEGKPAAALIVVHGNGEHTGRYTHMARWFAERRVAVYCMDQRGYGRSGGVRGHVSRFDEYLADLRIFVDLVAEYSAGLARPVLLGHSLGGLVALRYAEQFPETLRGLILCSPWLALARPFPAPARAVIGVLSVVAPRLHWDTSGRGGGPDRVRRDPAMSRFVAADPLRVRRMTPRWFTEVTRAQRAAIDDAINLDLPSLWLQAGSDHVVSAAVSRQAFDCVHHADKTFHLFPEAYHELHNEPEAERTRIFGLIEEWLQVRGILVSGG